MVKQYVEQMYVPQAADAGSAVETPEARLRRPAAG
jgi:hypothetical protein